MLPAPWATLLVTPMAPPETLVTLATPAPPAPAAAPLEPPKIGCICNKLNLPLRHCV